MFERNGSKFHDALDVLKLVILITAIMTQDEYRRSFLLTGDK